VCYTVARNRAISRCNQRLSSTHGRIYAHARPRGGAPSPLAASPRRRVVPLRRHYATNIATSRQTVLGVSLSLSGLSGLSSSILFPVHRSVIISCSLTSDMPSSRIADSTAYSMPPIFGWTVCGHVFDDVTRR